MKQVFEVAKQHRKERMKRKCPTEISNSTNQEIPSSVIDDPQDIYPHKGFKLNMANVKG